MTKMKRITPLNWRHPAILKILKKSDYGAIAQLVEQRTENPCVLGSIPSGTT